MVLGIFFGKQLKVHTNNSIQVISNQPKVQVVMDETQIYEMFEFFSQICIQHCNVTIHYYDNFKKFPCYNLSSDTFNNTEKFTQIHKS